MIKFSKYSATGNDFIVIDNRKHFVDASDDTLWKRLCSRRTGIGADGVLLVEHSDHYDFKMRYINSDDGLEAEMCGNGGRAIVHFFHNLTNDSKSKYMFETMNSTYEGQIVSQNMIKLRMSELYDEHHVELKGIGHFENVYYVNTGVPHVVLEVDDIQSLDVNEIGRQIRYDSRFKDGTNVNFILPNKQDHEFQIRTYERGVEKETLSCGTGITASALACQHWYGWEDEIDIRSQGGDLKVHLNSERDKIYLIGAVHEIYQGTITD